MKGQIGDCDLLITLVDNLKDAENSEEKLDGRARKRQKVQLVEVELDSGLDGRALFNTMLHELLHLCEHVYGWSTRHEEVWLLAAGLSQALITTGIVDPLEFEARVRRLCMPPEELEEPK